MVILRDLPGLARDAALEHLDQLVGLGGQELLRLPRPAAAPLSAKARQVVVLLVCELADLLHLPARRDPAVPFGDVAPFRFGRASLAEAELLELGHHALEAYLVEVLAGLDTGDGAQQRAVRGVGERAAAGAL